MCTAGTRTLPPDCLIRMVRGVSLCSLSHAMSTGSSPHVPSTRPGPPVDGHRGDGGGAGGDNAARGHRIPDDARIRSRMNPLLEQLIRLQRAESELRRTQAGLAEIPRRKAELEGELAADRAHLDAARASLDESIKARRRHEADLQDLEGKR